MENKVAEDRVKTEGKERQNSSSDREIYRGVGIFSYFPFLALFEIKGLLIERRKGARGKRMILHALFVESEKEDGDKNENNEKQGKKKEGKGFSILPDLRRRKKKKSLVDTLIEAKENIEQGRKRVIELTKEVVYDEILLYERMLRSIPLFLFLFVFILPALFYIFFMLMHTYFLYNYGIDANMVEILKGMWKLDIDVVLKCILFTIFPFAGAFFLGWFLVKLYLFPHISEKVRKYYKGDLLFLVTGSLFFIGIAIFIWGSEELKIVFNAFILGVFLSMSFFYIFYILKAFLKKMYIDTETGVIFTILWKEKLPLRVEGKREGREEEVRKNGKI